MKQIDRVRDDESVVGVVLRVASPGGTVTGSDYIYHHLRELETRREKHRPADHGVSQKLDTAVDEVQRDHHQQH